MVLVHGFTQTARSWDVLAGRLADRHEVLAVDAPGHGRSADWRTGLWASADALVDTAGTGTYIGYSMGARLVLHAALAHPDRVRAMVLIGATPGIVDPEEREQRRRADEALAHVIERDGVAAFIESWLANPLFAGLSADNDQRADRLTNTAAGLASSLRLAGTGTQDDLWPRLGELGQPTLLITGALDTKFSAIASAMAASMAHADHVVIAGVGHPAHTEAPEVVGEIIMTWIAGLAATA